MKTNIDIWTMNIEELRIELLIISSMTTEKVEERHGDLNLK